MKSTTARLVLPLSLMVIAGVGTAAFAGTPESSWPPPENCTTVGNDPYVGYELGGGRVGACVQSGNFVDETYATVLTGTNKGVVVHPGIGGPDYGAWVGSGQECVQVNWSPTCV